MRVTAALVVVCVLACSAISASQITLTISPSHVLPGVPATLHLVMARNGDRQLVVPTHIVLRVVPLNGKPFLAEWGNSNEHPLVQTPLPGTVDVPGLGLILNADSEFVFRADDFGHPGWFADPRLNTPGRYQLQVVLVKDGGERLLSRAKAVEIVSDPPNIVVSTEAILTVDEPRGDDARLWRQLVSLTRGHASAWSTRWWLPADARVFAKSALRFPSSPYTAYAAPYFASTNPEDRVWALREILDAQPGTPLKDNLEILLGEAEVSAAQHALSTRHASAKHAIELYDQARMRFEALERNAADPDVKRRSRADREKLPGTEEIRAAAASAH